MQMTMWYLPSVPVSRAHPCGEHGQKDFAFNTLLYLLNFLRRECNSVDRAAKWWVRPCLGSTRESGPTEVETVFRLFVLDHTCSNPSIVNHHRSEIS